MNSLTSLNGSGTRFDTIQYNEWNNSMMHTVEYLMIGKHK
jgi:hypothetical protein